VIHLAARLHAFLYGLFRPKERTVTKALYDEVARDLERHGLAAAAGRSKLALAIAEDVLGAFDAEQATPGLKVLASLIIRLFDYESLFALPRFDWAKRHSIADYWEVKDNLTRQKAWLEEFDRTREQLTITLLRCLDPIVTASPQLPSGTDDADGISVPTDRIRAIGAIGTVTEAVMRAVFDEDLEAADLFTRHRARFESNLIIASSGNPADSKNFTRAPKLPSRSDIRDPHELVDTYLGPTPIGDLFEGSIPFTIPNRVRFEHHHIVAGSGHGKTQTLQYLIAKDLEAVGRGERSVIVLDSQGDLIRTISGLAVFAPGGPLHERIVIIDPSDVEWPVSLNLFDVGLERLGGYSQLDRERLTNSILELYDFVLGSLLSAEMTQKQNVIFRYVTRLMLHIPDARCHHPHLA
jgi:hypothetical protein